MNETYHLMVTLLPRELMATLYMVFVSGFLSLVFGLPLGVLLTVTQKDHLFEKKWFYRFLEAIINIARSFPFAILMVAVIPLTRALVGTSLGTTASIVPLTLAAIPFMARLIESNLKEVEKSTIEAAIVMGSRPFEVITKVMLQEALPSIINSISLTLVNLIGSSAMVGLVGGGGLGQVAITYGYHRFNGPMMLSTVVILVLLVMGVQNLGDLIYRKICVKRGLK